MGDERKKICDLPKGTCDKARKEARLLYVDWDSECVMSAPSSGATPLSDEEIAKRVKSNKKTSARRKEINTKLSELHKAMSTAGREGNADEVARLSKDVTELETEKATLKMFSVPSRKGDEEESEEESKD